MTTPEENAPMHVYPVNDLKEHDVENGANCLCNPVVHSGEYCAETGTMTEYSSVIIVHNAWDGRK